MYLDAILNPLNEAQRAAVSAQLVPVLVLAGAGSGKTRVLTHRIAWLIQVEHASPYSILAVTFTNKAAGEMRGRVEQILGAPPGVLWIGTFHGIAHRLLRLHWREAGLTQGFQILDSDDQQRLVKRIIKANDLDESRWEPREVQWFINSNKDEGRRPKDLKAGNDPTRAQMIRLYGLYEEACARTGVVDFAELLLRAYELWRDRPDLLAHYRQRFRHVLVDEFQDTNSIQYAWLRLIAGPDGHPFAVGDDDQSIYRWRGARVENLQQFRRDYERAKLYRLEQNYRSTAAILAAANALIAHNTGRLGKTLWTNGEPGLPLQVYAAFNERDEAEFVARRVIDYVASGSHRSDVAVLYRSNSQSRAFEEAFIAARIPYKVYGGLRFFERAEIKDALAYMRLLLNRDDDAAYERVVNLPTRGIGDRTIEMLREEARSTGISLWKAGIARSDAQQGGRTASALRGFQELIDRLAQETAGLVMHEQIDHVIRESGLIEHHGREKSGQDSPRSELARNEARVENLAELVSAARSFGAESADLELPPLEAFLAHAALESGERESDAGQDSVQMMTLHMAKGLEFRFVFLCGMEEGLFPHNRCMSDLEALEEERRLCYVGMTRAMKHLYLTYAEQRRLHGMDTHPAPSRFIKEVPQDIVAQVRPRLQVARAITAARARREQPPAPTIRFRTEDPPPPGMRLGARVRHGKFGEGVVLNVEGSGPHARVQVNFEQQGTKWLMMQYANLEPV
ncbi:MAG TPA: DNA helicase II [Steroidobacteraceae bacterium]|jgi:DNA helicase-2/ATP-dependent DNA helicase PcrA|nr:DNA helicase II [Steroidobacteraceae bacterium]